MAEELTKVELYGNNNDGDVRRFTIASDAVITKGALLTLTDPRTVTGTSAARAVLAGIAAEGHDGLDFSDSISVWTNGIFEAYASGAITIGAPIGAAAFSATIFNNRVKEATLVASGAEVLGYALEVATDAEVINIRVRL